MLSGRPTYVEWMSAEAKARSGSVLQSEMSAEHFRCVVSSLFQISCDVTGLSCHNIYYSEFFCARSDEVLGPSFSAGVKGGGWGFSEPINLIRGLPLRLTTLFGIYI